MTIPRALRGIGAFLLAGVLAACANEAATPAKGGGAGGGQGGNGNGGSAGNNDGGADKPSGEGETVELKVAWWGSAERDMRTRLVFKLFEVKHPNIKIVEEHYAGVAGAAGVGYWSTMEQHATASTLPDIMQHDYAYIETWTDKGRLVALDDLASAGTINLTDVAPALVDGGRVKGKLMGITLGLNTQTIVIDTDQFTKAGVTVPSDEWTWEDFETTTLQLKQRLGIWGFGADLWNTTLWRSLYLSKGTWVFSPDGKSLGFTDDQPWIDHLNMILRLLKAGAIPTREQQSSSNIFAEYDIVKGKAAMDLLGNSNQLNVLWTALGSARNLKLLPLPRIKGAGSSVYLKPSQYFSVTANSKHPKEAAQLIDFFLNDVDANLVLLGERGVPVPGKVLAAIKPKLGRMEAEAFNVTERAAKGAAKVPPLDRPAFTPVYSQIYVPKVIDPVMHLVWTPQMATMLFRKEANDALMGKGIPDGGAPPIPRPADAAAPAVDAGSDGPRDATGN